MNCKLGNLDHFVELQLQQTGLDASRPQAGNLPDGLPIGGLSASSDVFGPYGLSEDCTVVIGHVSDREFRLADGAIFDGFNLESGSFDDNVDPAGWRRLDGRIYQR